MGRYYIYLALQWIVRSFPLKLSYALAEFLSNCQYTFSGIDRKAVIRNIETLEPDMYLSRKIAREVFVNFGRYLVEFLWMRDHLNKDNVREHVEVIGEENLASAYEEGKGVVMVTGHIGHWELGAAAISLMGYAVSAIALDHPHPNVNQFFIRQRQSKGVKVVSTQNAIRECVRDLSDGRVIAIVAERDFHDRGQRMPFLEKNARIPKGAAMFASKGSAPIVPAFLMRTDEQMKFRLHIHPPIRPDDFKKISDDKERINAIIAAYISMIENAIRQDPAQWLMFRDYDE